MTPRARAGAGFDGVGRACGDFIFLALVAGALAKLAWFGHKTRADWVGLVSLGGDMAALMAYFIFVLFGLLSLRAHAAGFWRGLHPVNFGLSLIVLSFYPYDGARAAGLITAVVLAAPAAALLQRRLTAHPRRLLCGVLAFIALVALWRFAPFAWRNQLRGVVSRDFLLYGIAAAGGFLVTMAAAAMTRGFLHAKK